MRGVALLIAAAVLLAGCGGGDDGSDDKGKAEPSVEAEAPPDLIGLSEACPRIRAALDIDDLESTQADWITAANELGKIGDEGDGEVDALLEEIQPAVDAYLDYTTAGRPAGEGMDAFSSFTEAQEAVASSCS